MITQRLDTILDAQEVIFAPLGAVLALVPEAALLSHDEALALAVVRSEQSALDMIAAYRASINTPEPTTLICDRILDELDSEIQYRHDLGEFAYSLDS